MPNQQPISVNIIIVIDRYTVSKIPLELHGLPLIAFPLKLEYYQRYVFFMLPCSGLGGRTTYVKFIPVKEYAIRLFLELSEITYRFFLTKIVKRMLKIALVTAHFLK